LIGKWPDLAQANAQRGGASRKLFVLLLAVVAGYALTRASCLINTPGHARIRERRHPRMTGQRRAQENDGERRTGCFAKTHAEIQQGMKTKLVQERTMSRLGRDMRSAAVIEEPGIEARKRQDRRGRHEPIEQNGDLIGSCGERSPRDSGELAPSQGGGDSQRIAQDSAMVAHRRLDDRALALQPRIVDAGSPTDPLRRTAAENRRAKRRRRGGISDAHLP
jgi:hypothetical protein